MPALPTDDSRLFSIALAQLKAYSEGIGREHKGRLVQLFLGLKFFQTSLPSMFSGQFVSTEVLQSSLDDLYARMSRPPNDCVLMIFQSTYLSRTGLVGAGNTVAQNTWRNHFNLQKGVGCYAPTAELASPTFLGQPRVSCSHLRPITPGRLSGASCALDAASAKYRNEDHPKWLQMKPGEKSYAVVDLMNIQNFRETLAPGGTRIPVLPLIVALYHDALPSTQAVRPNGVTTSDFMADFSISQPEFQAYFDESPTNAFNSVVMSAGESGSLLPPSPVTTPTTIPIPTPQASTPLPRQPRLPVLSGTPVPPPAINTGWAAAEESVRDVLSGNGWNTFNVSRQQLGYDLLAQKGRRTVYFEVKSSLGQCNPRLTEREWQQAARLGSDYILAVIENYNPTGVNTIYWVPDPTNSLAPSISWVKQYAISRAAWQAAAIDLTRI